MHIICTTTEAAGELMLVLTDAYMRPGKEFHISVPHAPDPPIRFTVHVNLPAHILHQMQSLPDIHIADACCA